MSMNMAVSLSWYFSSRRKLSKSRQAPCQMPARAAYPRCPNTDASAKQGTPTGRVLGALGPKPQNFQLNQVPRIWVELRWTSDGPPRQQISHHEMLFHATLGSTPLEAMPTWAPELPHHLGHHSNSTKTPVCPTDDWTLALDLVSGDLPYKMLVAHHQLRCLLDLGLKLRDSSSLIPHWLLCVDSVWCYRG